MNKLLLVIDVQLDFINENTKPILNEIIKLIDSKTYNKIAFTRFINDKNSIWYKKLNYKGCMTNEGQKIVLDTKDYKVFNFDGEPKLIQVDFNRFSNHKRNLYSTDWEYVEAAILYPTDPEHVIARPKGLELMLELARKLSVGIPHVRTDFYSIDDKVYFGEMTFYHGAGYEKFTPDFFGSEMGSWLKLPGGGI